MEAEPAGAFVVVGGSGNVGSGRGGAIKSGFHQGDVGPEVKIVNADSARCVVKVSRNRGCWEFWLWLVALGFSMAAWEGQYTYPEFAIPTSIKSRSRMRYTHIFKLPEWVYPIRQFYMYAEYYYSKSVM